MTAKPPPDPANRPGDSSHRSAQDLACAARPAMMDPGIPDERMEPRDPDRDRKYRGLFPGGRTAGGLRRRPIFANIAA